MDLLDDAMDTVKTFSDAVNVAFGATTGACDGNVGAQTWGCWLVPKSRILDAGKL